MAFALLITPDESDCDFLGVVTQSGAGAQALVPMVSP